MKLHIASDLHLEFGSQPEFKGDLKNRILIVAGDLAPVNMPNDLIVPFLNKWRRKFKHIIYIAGNHEFYHGDIIYHTELLRELIEPLKNVHFLDCSTVEIDDVLFAGTTLWTNMHQENPMTMIQASWVMNDFNLIKKGGVKFTANMWLDEHKRSVDWLRAIRQDNPSKELVVITHHAPCSKSIPAQYIGSKDNDYYVSSLEHLIIELDAIVWVHGHNHIGCQYQCDNTLVVNNPLGYHGYEESLNFKNNFMIEI